MEKLDLDKKEAIWETLSKEAWSCRNNALVLGKTKVGSAALSSKGNVFGGCNVEHRFRSHDIHAEVSAISSLVSAGDTKLEKILIVADRDSFTPCGSCMDWIFEIGGPDCIAGFQNKQGGDIKKFLARDLMPHYPM